MEQGRGSSMQNRFTSFDRIREYGKMNKKKREYHETDRKVSDGRERSLSAEQVEKNVPSASADWDVGWFVDSSPCGLEVIEHGFRDKVMLACKLRQQHERNGVIHVVFVVWCVTNIQEFLVQFFHDF